MFIPAAQYLNDVFGDPLQGVVKELHISYFTEGGSGVEVRFGEHSHGDITLVGPAGAVDGAWITRASYSVPGAAHSTVAAQDVTGRLRGLVRTSCLVDLNPAASLNGLFGDPAPGVAKELNVTYVGTGLTNGVTLAPRTVCVAEVTRGRVVLVGPAPDTRPGTPPGPAPGGTRAFSLASASALGHTFQVRGAMTYAPGTTGGPGGSVVALQASVALEVVVDGRAYALGTLDATPAGVTRDLALGSPLPLGTSVAGVPVPLQVAVSARASARVVPVEVSASRSAFRVEVGVRVSLDGGLDVSLGLTGAGVQLHGSMVDASASLDVVYSSSPGQVCLGAAVTYAAPTLSASARGWVRVCTPGVPGWCAVPGGCLPWPINRCWDPTGCVPPIPEQCVNRDSSADTGLRVPGASGAAPLFANQCAGY